MRPLDTARIVNHVSSLLAEHYVDQPVAAELAGVLADGLAAGRYDVSTAELLAEVVTADLQSRNGDKHLRLAHHDEELAEREPGDDAEEYAAMTRWARSTCRGVRRVECIEPNIGLVEINPVLFPVGIAGSSVSAAMSLVADSEALIIDLRGCRGGDPDQVAWLASYLFGHDTVELSSLDEPTLGKTKQSWTLAHVPGARFGPRKPVYVLTSASTFSGGEQLSYDLQALGRATVVGEQTRGGAHAREGFRVHPHLEATISVARAVSPVTGTNWEGVGVTPDVAVSADQALDRAVELARAATS